MRKIETEFFPTEDRPEYGLGLSVYLGPVDWPPLAGLRDRETILLVEPGELEAPAIVRLVRVHDQATWFGELASHDVIRVTWQRYAAAGQDE